MAILNKPFSSRPIFKNALKMAIKKFNPVQLIANPVIFITEIGAIITSLQLFNLSPSAMPFATQIAIWLWLTVFFANFAEAMAESRHLARAAPLHAARNNLYARRIDANGREERIRSNRLKKDDVVIVAANETVPGDGEIIEGTASIDESSITGESMPIIRTAGSDRSAVLGGTKVLSDQIRVRISAAAGQTFLDRMIQLIETAKRKRTPNEIALTILLSGISFIFCSAVITFKIFSYYFHTDIPLTMLISLLVCIIPTTISGLLSAIGIAGVNRLLKKNVLAMSGQAVEAAGDIDIILIDKTGTITIGDRQASHLIPALGVTQTELAKIVYLASIHDTTREGKSAIAWIQRNEPDAVQPISSGAVPVAFSAYSRMSGINIANRQIRKGAIDAVESFCGVCLLPEMVTAAQQISQTGATPMLVAERGRIFGLIQFKDVVKEGLSEQFQRLRALGIKTIMITGDNPVTAATIAREAGIDEYRAQMSPENKLAFLFELQDAGYLVAMTGDGVNDAPALAFADVGLAMNYGAQAAKRAGNMIDFDSNPTKLFEIIEIGKQMLMTRGALTAFSIANDLAKYLIVIPALLIPLFPSFSILNLIHLTSPASAVLSAVMYNALVIPALIPLAFRGIQFTPQNISQILPRNLIIYGMGGLALPFFGIKSIDLFIHWLGCL
jgi:K+-transporting ATPase ATPase B chain